MPLFFAFTGLRMNLSMIKGREMWFCCGLIILVASFGKLAGSAAASRLMGSSSREALGLGVLMNTRGLMEFVILNLGFNLGIVSPALFSMMVLMALVTTFMATPVLEVLYRAKSITLSPTERNQVGFTRHAEIVQILPKADSQQKPAI
jgi:Kef-type K+ transport system membrane component KefB